MKKAEVRIGSMYTARVSGDITTVRLDAIREVESRGRMTVRFDVTNLRTGRKLSFASATKFRREVKPQDYSGDPARPFAPREKDEPTWKLCKDLQIGDVLKTWDGTHTITRFDEHPGLTRGGVHHTARVAVSGEWGMTIFDHESLVNHDGMWMEAHHLPIK